MKLYSAILMTILAKEEVEVTFPNLNADVNKLMESECYRALEKMKAALDDLSISDEEAFFKISNIMLELETSGWSGMHRNPPDREENGHSHRAGTGESGGTSEKPNEIL